MTKVKQSFVFGATGQDKTSKFVENGVIRIIVLKLPAFTNNPTVTISLLDDEGNTIWTDAGAPRADDATYLIDNLMLPVDYGFTMKMHLSADAGAGGGTGIVKSFITRQ